MILRICWNDDGDVFTLAGVRSQADPKPSQISDLITLFGLLSKVMLSVIT